MPVAQWLILVMGLSTITPDSGSQPNSSDSGERYSNGAGGLSSTGGGGFGSGFHAGSIGHGIVNGSGGADANDSSWTGGDHSAHVNNSTGVDGQGDTAAASHGPAGIRLPAGESPLVQPTDLRRSCRYSQYS